MKLRKLASKFHLTLYKMAEKLISKIPEGPLSEKWTKHKSQIRVVSPANKKKMEVIVVGTGLGGASAAASLGELGYNVKVFCISDSRSEERRVGKECNAMCRSRWSPYH